MEAKNRTQVEAEISELIKFQDLTGLRKIMSLHFPKARGYISKLETPHLSKLLELLKEEYKK